MSVELARLLVKLGRDAEYVIRDLEAIRAELALRGSGGAGGSLTPAEYQLISDTLIPIGILGAEVLVDDLERTAEAEG